MAKKFRALLGLLITLALLLPSSFISSGAYAEFYPESQPTPPPDPLPDFEREPNHLAGRALDDQAAGPGWLLSAPRPGESLLPSAPASLPVIATAVASGLSQTCALTADGGVRCWGDNYLGQLGDGTTQHRTIPVNVLGMTTGVSMISSSHKHACALLATGGVKCWGYNYHGELGDGTTVNRLSPVPVEGLSGGVAAIAAGGFHTCALIGDGTVMCWGANWHGEIGDGTTRERLTPVQVDDVNSAIAIAAGKFHTCALLQNRDVLCWGYNRYGQQGNGSTSDNHTPKKVAGLSNAVAIGAGALHTCALINDGRVRCWGDNLEGQIGDGTQDMQVLPVNVNGLNVGSGVAALSLGAFHTCALISGGSVRCWGDNWAGQVGDGSTTDQLVPVTVAGLPPGIQAVGAGDSHTCAVTGDGQVACWGSNGVGQLGNLTSALRLTPVNVANLGSSVLEIQAGTRHACALTGSGGVKCWGNNKYGQLGDGSAVDRLVPVDVTGLTSGVTALGVGKYHSCAVTGGGLKCWGDNTNGQLGDGTMDERWVPTDVYGLPGNVTAVSAGSEHTCALTGTGGVYCWGNNSTGRLGIGTNVDSLVPVQVTGLAGGVAELQVGESHTCVVTTAGGLKCWGYNFNGQLGVGSTEDEWAPVNVPGMTSGVSMVSANSGHTCALNDQGGLKCWGANFSGEVGDGTFATRLSPVQVLGLSSGVTAVQAGTDFTCAALEAGGLQCWGDNWKGQLGDGTTEFRAVPGAVVGISGIVSDLAGGGQFACVKVSGAGPQCWGTNGNGQIGDGSVPWQTAPAEVIGLTPATLAINYAGGQPDSFFTLTGSYFMPLEQVEIFINSHPITGTIITTDQGSMGFLLSTAQADEGDYIIKAKATLSGINRFTLDAALPLRPQEGTGLILQVPPGIAYGERTYLPLFQR